MFKQFPIGLKQNLREGQPLYKEQTARPQSVLYSEVLLYCFQTGYDSSHATCAMGSLIPVHEKRRSAWYALFAYVFKFHKMWGLRAIM